MKDKGEHVMKKYLRNVAVLTLAMVLILSQLSFVQADGNDYTGHWGEANIAKALELGIIKGYPNGEFGPDRNITRAEFVTMLDNLFGFVVVEESPFGDVKANDWFADSVLKASANGIVLGSNGYFRPNALITREEAAVILTRAFVVSNQNAEAYKAFNDAENVSTWATSALSGLVEKGYMQGKTGNVLAPKVNLTRAEAVTLINNIMGDLVKASGTVTGDYAGNVVVNVADVTLDNVTIDGNLYITQGVGEGDVTLNNVVVKGELVALGGGENSIVINNSEVNSLIVIKVGGKIRIVATGSSKVNAVALQSGAKLEEENLTGDGFGKVEVIKLAPGESLTLDGDYEEINVQAPNVSLAITEGSTVNTLNVTKQAANTTINVATGGSVGTLTLDSSTTVTGTGTVTTAVVNTSGTTFETKPETLDVEDDVTTTVGDDVIDDTNDDDTTTTPPADGGSTGGGGGGGGGGGTPTPDTTIHFALSSNADEVTLNVEATNNTYYGVLKAALEAVNDQFDTLYNDYATRGDAAAAKFIFDHLSLFEYVTADKLDGTVFDVASLTDKLSPNVSLPYSDAEKKAIAQEVLTILIANLDSEAEALALKADSKEVANQVDFSTVQYDGKHFSSITVKDSSNATIAHYEDDLSRAEYIDDLFTELQSLSVNTTETYTMTIILEDSSTRTATLEITD